MLVRESASVLGVERTISCLRRHFFWPGMQTQVQQYHSMCPRCQMRKTDAVQKAPLKPFTVSFPLEVIELDFLSLGRPQDPYQNILVMTDMFSRYAWAIPTRDQTARTTARSTVPSSSFGVLQLKPLNIYPSSTTSQSPEPQETQCSYSTSSSPLPKESEPEDGNYKLDGIVAHRVAGKSNL